MSSVNEPPGIQDPPTSDAKDSIKLTSEVNAENGVLRRSGRRRSSKKSQNDLPADEDKMCNGTVNPAFLGDGDDQLNSTTQTPADPPTNNPNYLVNGGGQTVVTSNGAAHHITIPDDALLNHHSARIRLKKKSEAEKKEAEANAKNVAMEKDEGLPDSVIIPMNGVQRNGQTKDKGQKETTMSISDHSRKKVKDVIPVSSPLTSEKTAPKDKASLEEYFVPANTRKKFLRGEKLYLTSEKRKGGCSWKKVAISGCLLAVLAAAVLIGVLAATGILPAGQSEMLSSSSPTMALPAQASVSMHSRGESALSPRTSSSPAVGKGSTSPTLPRRTTTLSQEVSSATTVPHLVNQLPIVTTQAPVIVPYVLKGRFSVLNSNFSDSLNDENSRDFRSIASALEAQLRNVFNDTESFSKVEVIRLLPGSIRVQYLAYFDRKYDSAQVQKIFRNYLDAHGGFLDQFQVDAKSVVFQKPENECNVSNGECSDICTYDSDRFRKECSCMGEGVLQPDRLTCLVPTESPASSLSSGESSSTSTNAPQTKGTTMELASSEEPSTTTLTPDAKFETFQTTTITQESFTTTEAPLTTVAAHHTTATVPQSTTEAAPSTTEGPSTTMTASTSTERNDRELKLLDVETTVSPVTTTVSPVTTTVSPVTTTGSAVTGSPVTTTGNPVTTAGSFVTSIVPAVTDVTVPIALATEESTIQTDGLHVVSSTTEITTENIVPVTSTVAVRDNLSTEDSATSVVVTEAQVPETTALPVVDSTAVTNSIAGQSEVLPFVDSSTTPLSTESPEFFTTAAVTVIPPTEITSEQNVPTTLAEVRENVNVSTTQGPMDSVTEIPSESSSTTEAFTHSIPVSFDTTRARMISENDTVVLPMENDTETATGTSQTITFVSETETPAVTLQSVTVGQETTLSSAIGSTKPVREVASSDLAAMFNYTSTSSPIAAQTEPITESVTETRTSEATGKFTPYTEEITTGTSTPSSVQLVTDTVAKQVETAREERSSQATPSDGSDYSYTEISKSSGFTIDSLTSGSDDTTDVMVNVNPETTTTEKTMLSGTTTYTGPALEAGSRIDSQNVTDQDLSLIGSENDTTQSPGDPLTTISLANDTLVDEFSTTQTSDVDVMVNGSYSSLNETSLVYEAFNGTGFWKDELTNDTTDFQMFTSTDNNSSMYENDTALTTESLGPNNWTVSDVVSISGRRLDDTNATTFYEDDQLRNATAYDGLISFNDTEFSSDNWTAIEENIRLENETETLNDTTMIDDIMKEVSPEMNNASFIEGCPKDQFRCNNDSEECLPDSKRCDGINDCPSSGGFDELNCFTEPFCGKNFHCMKSDNNSQCITSKAVCDGMVDCGDGSDEMECGGKDYCDRIQKVSCSDNSYCIKPLEICDNHYNCLDKSDERDCIDRSACVVSNGFFCDDALCLPPGLRCDGLKDCKNGEDEADCTCEPDWFQCSNGTCIEGLKRCDGEPHCSDGSDEMECVRVDSNGVVQIYDASNNTWSFLCYDPENPWRLEAGHELCQELGFSAAESVGKISVDTNISTSYQWRSDDTTTGYWRSRLSHRDVCSTDKVATVTCTKYECGDLKHEDGRRKNVEQWPFMATINGQNKQHACRAEIITPLWLLTSVGCLKHLEGNHTDWVAKVEQVDLLSSALSSNLTQTRMIKSVVTHPHASIFRSRILYDFDMALIRLSNPLKFDDTMAAVCLPDEEVKPGITCFTLSLRDNHANGKKVKFVPLMVSEKDQCNLAEHYKGGVSNQMLCTGSNELCEQEDAAALACISIDEKWYLAGLLSYQRHCGAYKVHPAVYTNIFAMRDYIEKVVGMKMYNVTDTQKTIYYQIRDKNHDAEMIDDSKSTLSNTIGALEPIISHPNATESNSTDTLYNDYNATDNLTIVDAGTVAWLDSSTIATGAESNDSDTVDPLPGDLENNHTIYDTDEILVANNDTSLLDSIDNDNTTTTNSSMMLGDSPNRIDISNDTVDTSNDTVDTSYSLLSRSGGIDETTTHSQRIPPPVMIFDSESATQTTVGPSSYPEITTLLTTSEVPLQTTVISLNTEVTTVPSDENVTSIETASESYTLGEPRDNDTTTMQISIETVTSGAISNETTTTSIRPSTLSLDTSSRLECEGDNFRCLGSTACTPSETVCDGIYHCQDMSDEWSCVRLNQTNSVVEIRHHSFGWSTVCSDNWSGDLSHKVCNQLGYMSALLTDHVAVSNQSTEMLFQVTKPDVRLVQGALSANESAECNRNEIVAVTCSEFQCGLWSLKTEDGFSSEEGTQGRQVGSGALSTTARDGEWPSMAIVSNGERVCSASALSKRWLLTSLSCLRNGSGDEHLSPANWTVVTGTSVSSKEDPGPTVSLVDYIVPHPDNGNNSNSTDDDDCWPNDMALIRLSSSLSFGRFASAVCLPQKNFRPRELCVVATWERTGERSILYYQPVSTTDATAELECDSSRLESDDVLCPGLVNAPHAPRENNSGSVLMCINHSHHWEIHGIVSSGQRCGPNVSYTNVYSHSKWIASTIKEN